jgi:hypothetical protein
VLAREAMGRTAARLSLLAVMAASMAGCGGGPPRELGGFSLGMSQEQVMAEARRAGGFTCHVRGTRPRLTTCEGETPDGTVQVTVREDTTVAVALARDPSGRNPQRQMRRFVRGFGDPAWRDRPFPNRSDPTQGFHTLWLSADSTQSIALVCAERRLQPPCTAEIAVTSPARVHASLDALMGIQR